MKQVTRDVDLAANRDLLERVRRACLSFAGADGPQLLPVSMIWQDGRFWVGLLVETPNPPLPGQEAVLLSDAGIYYFELRAVYLRGQVQPAEAPPGAAAGRAWFELVAQKTVAWDYGSMRKVEHER